MAKKPFFKSRWELLGKTFTYKARRQCCLSVSGKRITIYYLNPISWISICSLFSFMLWFIKLTVKPLPWHIISLPLWVLINKFGILKLQWKTNRPHNSALCLFILLGKSDNSGRKSEEVLFYHLISLSRDTNILPFLSCL